MCCWRFSDHPFPDRQESAKQQKIDSEHFLPVPGSNAGVASMSPNALVAILISLVLGLF